MNDDTYLESCSNPLKKYKVRPGTVESGRLYEAKMTALVCLRCIDKNTKEIWMASNVNDIGDFDDIVLLKKSMGGSSIAYMVQLKHQDNPKVLKPADFLSNLTKNKDFKLSKYSKSFQLLKNKLKTSTEDEVDFIKYLRKVDRIILVLCTNKGVGECPFLKRHQNIDLSFLQTSSLNTDLYVFDRTQLQDCNLEFLESLYLLAEQTNVDGLDFLIKKEIKRLIHPLKLIDEDVADLCEQFAAFIKVWVQNKLEQQYFLTKSDIISKLISLLLNRFKVKLCDNLSTSLQSDIFHEICRVHTMTVLDWDETIFHFLVRYFAGRLEDYCGRNEPTVNTKKQEKKYWGSSFTHWGNNLRQQLKDFLYRKYEDFKEHMIKFEGNPEDVTFSDIYRYLWFTRQLPLLLEANTLEDFQSILRILELPEFTFRVILLNKTGKAVPKTETILKRFDSLEDLSEAHKKCVLNQAIKLQGKPSGLLRDIIDDSMFKYLSSNNVIHILLDDFNIGNVYEAPFDYFIERTVHRVLLKSSVLENFSNELFVIEKQPELILNVVDSSKTIKLSDVGSSDLGKRNIIIAEDIDDLKESRIQHLHESSNKTVHWLFYHRTNQLEWKKTFGSIKNIKCYRLEEREDYALQLTYTTDEMFLLPNFTYILSASPGMGKSTLLDSLVHRAPNDVWILNVNLNQHEAYYDSEECQNCQTPASVHLNYFCRYILEKHGCNSKLAKTVFQKMLEEKKILILLDGFDEISIFFKDEVTNIAKCLQREGFKVWVTTRPIMKLHLEEELNSISTTLKPFTMEDQEEFLEKYFTGVNASKVLTTENSQIMKKFVKELLATAVLNLNDRDREFMGIPLQIKLLAEAFNGNYLKTIETGVIKFNNSFDLLDLYENFVKTKINILCAKHGHKGKREFEKHKEYQYLSALKVLFKHQLLQKLNIDEKLQRCEELLGMIFFQKDGVMLAKNQFVHKTYAEYLSAKWLADNLYHKDVNICRTVKDLLNERFNQQYKFLFNIFDRIVCVGCYLYLSVINGQLEKTIQDITTSIDSIILEDKLGRSLLHIVALYGEFSPSQTFYEYLMKLNRDTKNNVAKIVELVLNYEITSIKDDKLGYSPLDYAIANGSLETANKICAHSKEIDIKVLLSLELKAKYFLFCAKMDYEHLFKTLLKHFSYNTLVSKVTGPFDGFCFKCWKKMVPHMTNEILEEFSDYVKTFSDNDSTKLLKYTTDSDFSYTRMIYNDLRIAIAVSPRNDVQLLMIKESKIDKQDVLLRTPLHYAVIFNKPDIVILLLQKEAQINMSDISGNTPLHYAVMRRLLDITDTLLEKDAKVNIKNKKGKTALQLAINSNKENLKSLFLKRGFTEETVIDSVSWDDNAAHRIVVDNKIVDVLIDCVFHQTFQVNNNNVVNDNQLSYNSNLQKVVTEDNLLTLQKYISNGGDVNVQNRVGDTALHWAVRQENTEAVKLLVSHKADVNITNNKGETPLFCSLLQESDDMSLLLLSDVEERKSFGNEVSPSVFNKNEEISNINISNCSATITNRTAKTNKQSIHQDRSLLLAIQRRKENIVKLLIARGVEVNTVYDMGVTALHAAAILRLHIVVSELLKAGAEINKQSANGNTPLHFAASEGHKNVVSLLLTRGADVNILGCNGNTVLHNAAILGSKDITSLLLYAGASAIINKGNKSCATPLHVAAGSGHIGVAKVLLANGADINRQNAEGYTPLQLAAGRDRLDVVKFLLTNGADINIASSDGNTVLHNAAIYTPQDTIATILEAGADINRQNANNETPLHLAAWKDRLDVLKFLLANGADINIASSDGNTVLHDAVIYASQDMIATILEAGGDINGKNANGDTVLHMAVWKDRLDIVKFLLANGADINVLENCERTALHTAVLYGSLDMVVALLDAGSEINKQNVENDTPIHLAVSRGRSDIVALLLARGAEVNILGCNGNTVLHSAVLSDKFEITLVLLDAGADVGINKKNSENETPLHLAVCNKQLEHVKVLLENGADINIAKDNGITSLQIATELDCQDIISELLKAVAELNLGNLQK